MITTIGSPQHQHISHDGEEAEGMQSENAQTVPHWRHAYRRAVLVADAVVLAVALGSAQATRFGPENAELAGSSDVTYTGIGLLVAAAWWLSLQFYGSTNRAILGDGHVEYQRVLHASLTTFGLVAILSLLFKQDLSRGYLAIAFPLGLVGLLLARKALRGWLKRRRSLGQMSSSVLIVGGVRAASSIAQHFGRHPEAGFKVSAVWVPDQEHPHPQYLQTPDGAVPILDSGRTLEDALSASAATTVIVSDVEHLGHDGLREMTWQLYRHDIDLMVSPNLVEISASRVQLRPVGSMPFMHMERPRFEDSERWEKVVFDKVVAVLGIVSMAPLFFAAALAVKFSSPGPILYRSERIGVAGKPFQMLKFRSMVVGADQLKSGVDSDTKSVLFKARQDPRVTRVGRILRRYSIDELPQLFNVLRGDMSIVGPRPPLRDEVDRYSEQVHRRLLVKQGITGLWQVSGRSDLDWDETVRLDMDYVENWSLMRDLQIVWRTVRVVLGSRGAY